MYILIEVPRMAVLYRCEKVETVRALANIEFVHANTMIFEETNREAYCRFSIENLQNLFKSLTGGTDPHSHNIPYLIGQIIRLCQTIPQSAVDGFEATVQSGQIKLCDKECYRYQKGVSYALKLTAPYKHPALLGNWNAAQGLPLPTRQTAPPAPAIAQPWADKPCATAPKYAPPWL